jgi:hypothetical protein
VPGWFDDAVIYGAIPVIVALGVLAAFACALRGDWRSGAGLGLDMWLGAGLLHLSIVLVRKMVTQSLARSAGPADAVPVRGASR